MTDVHYRCLSEKIFVDGEYRLVSIRHQDIQLIRQWRNEQIDVLRQKKEISVEEQECYFAAQVFSEFDILQPRQILFSSLKNGECIGYGGLVHIDWENARAEVSFLVDSSIAGQSVIYVSVFSLFLSLLKRVVFLDLDFHRIYTETFDVDYRIDHIKVLDCAGFCFEGRLKQHQKVAGKMVDSLVHGIIREHYNE